MTKIKQAHTPGPWIVGEMQDGYPVVYAPKKSELDGAWIATTHSIRGMMDGDANATLIAAAPRLLSALIRQRQYWELQASKRKLSKTEQGYLLDATAAISEAEGGK